MGVCANWVEEIEREIGRGEEGMARAGERHDGGGTVERRAAESDSHGVTENGIRFAMNSHICED